MASNDSGVDSSNDSFSTIDNSNNNSANTSMNSLGQEGSSNPLMDALCQGAQSFESFQSSSQSQEGGGGSSSSSQSFRRPDRKFQSSRHQRLAKEFNHHHSTRHALVPYVCKLPNERKLRLAASVSNIELLVRLLDLGVNPDTADEHLRSPLHLASSRGYKDVVKILLTRGANPNKQDSLGNTPLHLAVCSASSYNFNMVVRILLQNGARVNICDRTGKTPYDLARSKLLLMRSRLDGGITPESAKLFVEMSMLTGLLYKTLTQQRNDMEFDDLEERLRNLSTKEIEDGADNLLVDVAGLTLN
ncbi:ankyrin repeat domain-containing protein 54-like [Sitodiplosis mosellana]|uniref:ankyrin repeat domain-containing protein 54-like n=1 Tax=Sitodiplosis mosellana TaxID=263140 RepID=UPI0024443047|nr:ankyrin repeat domain-containing protein 54-like [Sitodiplosis mosellana]